MPDTSANGKDAKLMGLLGQPLTLDDLPSPNTRRWVSRRKAQVVMAVHSGLLSIEEACQRYTLSLEEFMSWERLIENHGLAGLRATRVQLYRQVDGPEAAES